jgi:hypothetical protein
MGEENIIRPLTVDERKTTIEVGNDDILNIFLARLTEKRTEYQKAYKPYDAYSARLDFEEKIRKIAYDASTVIDKEKIERIITFDNLDKYGEESRFELIGIKDVVEDKLLDGIRQPTKIGKYFKFKAKPRGNVYSMFVPNEMLTEITTRYQKEVDKLNKK